MTLIYNLKISLRYDPLLTITLNVKYESTRYKGKLIGYTRMNFNKI